MADMMNLDSLFSDTSNQFTEAVNGFAGAMNNAMKFGESVGNVLTGMTGGTPAQPQPPVQNSNYGQPYDPNSRIYSNSPMTNPYAQVQQSQAQSVNYGYGYSSNPNNPYNMNVNGDKRMYPGISNPRYGV